jgi:hypothetical protein
VFLRYHVCSTSLWRYRIQHLTMLCLTGVAALCKGTSISMLNSSLHEERLRQKTGPRTAEHYSEHPSLLAGTKPRQCAWPPAVASGANLKRAAITIPLTGLDQMSH